MRWNQCWYLARDMEVYHQFIKDLNEDKRILEEDKRILNEKKADLERKYSKSIAVNKAQDEHWKSEVTDLNDEIDDLTR